MTVEKTCLFQVQMKTSLLTYRHEDPLLAFIELLARGFIRRLSAAKDIVPLDILLSHFNCKSLYKITHANSIHVTQVGFCLTCIFTEQDSCTEKRKPGKCYAVKQRSISGT